MTYLGGSLAALGVLCWTTAEAGLADGTYLLCEQTNAAASKPDAHVYVVNFVDKVFFPAAKPQERNLITSENLDEFGWARREDKLVEDGTWHNLQETGRLSRLTGLGLKTVSDTTTKGTATEHFKLKCTSGKDRF